MRKDNFFFLWILVFHFFVYLSSTVGIMNSSDAPQYYLTKNIVDERRFNIDGAPYIYPDYAEYQGHQYSPRPLMESILAIPFYILAKSIQGLAFLPYDGNHVGINQLSKLESLTVMYNSFFGAFAVGLIYVFSRLVSRNRLIGFLISLLFGLGTLHWRYSSSFQRHSVVVFFIFLAYIKLYLLISRKKISRVHLFFIGLLLGFCVSLESFCFFNVSLILLFLLVWLFKNQKKKALNLAFLCLLGLVLPNLPSMLFNYYIFGKLFANPFQYIPHTPQYQNYVKLFSSPTKAIFVNLFNNGPIPTAAISPYLSLEPGAENNFSAYWAVRNEYKGIFIQSPYLFLSFIGIISLFKKNRFFLFLTLIPTIFFFLMYSKHIGYWSPNSYDTRYFLPVAGVLSLYLPFSFSTLIQMKKEIAKRMPYFGLRLIIFSFFIVSGLLAILSIYNGFNSNITNYAPHVTGERRYVLDNQKIDFSEILINTFPNYQNGLLVTAILFPLFILIGNYFFKILGNYLMIKNHIRE